MPLVVTRHPLALRRGTAAAAVAAAAAGTTAIVSSSWRTVPHCDAAAPTEIEPAVADLRCVHACPAPAVRQHSSHVVSPLRSLYDENGRFSLRVLARLVLRCAQLCFLFTPAALMGLLLATPLHYRFRARWLRLFVATLARCGPVGIKWGQWAATRYDLFEDDICEALGELANQAPAHPYAHTLTLVEAAFGMPLPQLFSSFEVEPIASGSIAQVHVATLRDGGARVAVKVQHPNLAESLPVDMYLLRAAAALSSKLPGLQDLRVHETVDQFASNFMHQLDFFREAANLRTFAANFGSPFWASLVSFPAPIGGLVARDVLVESFESGESVAAYLTKHGTAELVTSGDSPASTTAVVPAAAVVSADGAEGVEAEPMNDVLRNAIAFVGLQAFLKMLIQDNFVHADLHPGNVLIRFEPIGAVARLQRFLIMGTSLWEREAAHMVLLDAGLAASFDDRLQSHVGRFFTSIVKFQVITPPPPRSPPRHSHDASHTAPSVFTSCAHHPPFPPSLDKQGREFGESILNMSPTQPLVQSPDDFVAEVTAKMHKMRIALSSGDGRAGENIRDFMVSVRSHRVLLDPSVMVSLMSMMVLEGWQFRLDPTMCVFDNVNTALRGFGPGVFVRLVGDKIKEVFGFGGELSWEEKAKAPNPVG